MTKRTDCHREGAIIPAEYEHIMFYSHAQYPERPIGLNCVIDNSYEHPETKQQVDGKHSGDTCCLARMRETGARWAEHGGQGRCTACGAHFRYGEVWLHVPSGEHIHLGHDCALKFEMLADRSAFELELGRRKQAAAVQVERTLRAEERAQILAEHEGLEQDLKCGHRIVQEIAQRFYNDRPKLSDKQIALVRKLAAEERAPKVEEAHVPAPEGRQEFEGTIVSVKDMKGDWGVTTKITVKIETPAGSWLVWLTAPKGLDHKHCKRGSIVRMTATLARGRDAHFAIGKRPYAPECLFAAV